MRCRTASGIAVVLAMTLAVAGCSGREKPSGDVPRDASDTELVVETPPGPSEIDSVTWAMYREVANLDPLYAYDYPENTALGLVCEALLRQAPDGSIVDGITTLEKPDEVTMVFTLRPGVTFWDGSPVTVEDLIYSLERHTDEELGGYYGEDFEMVESITQTGDDQFTIRLKKYDAWFESALAGPAGMIVQKDFVEKVGTKYGTPSAGIMCTGAYEVTDWSAGAELVTTRYDGYWNSEVTPKAGQIVLKGVPDQSALTSALITGEIQGTYYVGLSTLQQLKDSSSVNVYEGPSYATDALVVASFDGVLGDVRARQALSLALDRQAMIEATYQGAGLIPRWLSNPGTFGYAKETFQKAYDAAAPMEQDLEKARALAEEAGIVGKTLHLGTTNELATIATDVAAYQEAAEAIGLEVELRAVSATNYIDFFTNKKARAGLDGFITVDYSSSADPALWLAGFATPSGGSNFAGYDNPELTELLELARFEADEVKRAEYVIEAQEIAAEELPYIPNVQPTTTAIMHESVSGVTAGFSYMTSAWADAIGGTR